MQSVGAGPASIFTAGMPSPGEARWRAAVRTALPFLVVGAIWEIVARLQIFPPRLFPPLEVVAAAFVRLTASGALPHHTLDTLLRLLAGIALAAIVGVVILIAMGRSRLAEDTLLPLISIGAPIQLVIPGFPKGSLTRPLATRWPKLVASWSCACLLDNTYEHMPFPSAKRFSGASSSFSSTK